MLISERSFYHGAALFEITESEHFTSINRVPHVTSPYTYQLNHNTGLYIKHCTSEQSPWKFTFSSEHQEDVRRIFDIYRERTFIIFVCGNTGFCIVDYGTFTACVDMNYTDNEWCEIYRNDGGSFRIRGAKGEFDRTIPLNAFPRILFE
jgi:hypothetical protein